MLKANLFQWVRTQVALARVLHAFDPNTAKNLGIEALTRFCDGVIGSEVETDGEFSDISPYISSDPSLLKMYSRCMDIKRTYDALQIKIEEFKQQSTVKLQKLKEEDRQRQLELEASTPTAQEIYKLLMDGSRFELNQHSIEFDTDFECLAGTNCYGVDYYYGKCTLLNVSVWRKAMIQGKVLGESPPGADLNFSELAELEDAQELDALEDTVTNCLWELSEIPQSVLEEVIA